MLFAPDILIVFFVALKSSMRRSAAIAWSVPLVCAADLRPLLAHFHQVFFQRISNLPQYILIVHTLAHPFLVPLQRVPLENSAELALYVRRIRTVASLQFGAD